MSAPAAATPSTRAPATDGKIKFAGDTGFHGELKRRVQAYFLENDVSPRDNLRMYLKTAAILLWFAASYVGLAFFATTWWQGLLLLVSLVLAVAGTGFAIQHDANHGAYSDREVVNRVMGMTLDMLGASSYVWHWKHNILHHTYTNVVGVDQDIDIAPFARLSPAQPRYRFHRLQQFYMWALYGFLLPKWHLIDDFQNVAQGRMAQSRFPRPRGWSLLEMVAGKVAFFAWAMAIPMFFHRWWVVLTFYAVGSFLVGFILSVVFQLAHCVEEASFPEPPANSDRMEHGWAAHQVQTTVNFARRNPILTWYLGGLNFQVEHHLFPKICHVHYPRISSIVQTVCAEFGVRYSAHDGFTAAIVSHWRWLRRMGRPVVVSAG
jgi:linoleoyl-CoA desaturase